MCGIRKESALLLHALIIIGVQQLLYLNLFVGLLLDRNQDIFRHANTMLK